MEGFTMDKDQVAKLIRELKEAKEGRGRAEANTVVLMNTVEKLKKVVARYDRTSVEAREKEEKIEKAHLQALEIEIMKLRRENEELRGKNNANQHMIDDIERRIDYQNDIKDKQQKRIVKQQNIIDDFREQMSNKEDLSDELLNAEKQIYDMKRACIDSAETIETKKPRVSTTERGTQPIDLDPETETVQCQPDQQEEHKADDNLPELDFKKFVHEFIKSGGKGRFRPEDFCFNVCEKPKNKKQRSGLSARKEAHEKKSSADQRNICLDCYKPFGSNVFSLGEFLNVSGLNLNNYLK